MGQSGPERDTTFPVGFPSPILTTAPTAYRSALGRALPQRAPVTEPALLHRDLLPDVLDTLDAVVVVLDTDERIALFNRCAQEISGYTEDEVLGRRFWEVLIPQDEQSKARAAYRRAPAGDHLDGYERGWIHRKGGRRLLSWRTRTLRGPDGSVEYLLATGVDVTDRRQAEAHAEAFAAEDLMREARTEALRISEKKLSGIVSLAQDAIIFVDETQTITLFNEGAERIFGYTAQEVVGRPLEVLIPPGAKKRHRDHVETFGESSVQARRMGDRHSIEGLRKDGTRFPADASIVKLDVGEERIYAALLRDVTERVEAQKKQRFLADAGEALASTLDYPETLSSIARLALGSLADLCIIDVVQKDGTVQRLTSVHREPARQEAADRLRDIPLDRDRPHLMWKALRQGRSDLRARVTPTHLKEMAQGREHLALLEDLGLSSFMVVPLRTRERVTGAVLLASSDPERRYTESDLWLAEELGRRAGLAMDNSRLYQEAQSALEVRDGVLSIVSHDLGNPLQAISMAAQALDRSVPQDDARGRYYLDALHRSTQLMERLIRDLLEIRRMEEGHLSLKVEPQAPGPMVSSALELVEPLASVKSVALMDRVYGALEPKVRADRDRVVQVLSNLLGNAVQHTPEGGTVTVESVAEERHLRIVVTDTGVGIPKEELGQIFHPFWQTPRNPGKGIGLGLTIAREIVDAHQGCIWAESAAGGGASVQFTLPYAREDAPDDSQ